MRYSNYIKIVLLGLLVLLSASCITNKDILYLQQEGSRKTYKSIPFEEYHLEMYDEISFHLMSTDAETQGFFNSIFTKEKVSYRIEEDGCITLPHVGKVKLIDLTIREAEKLMAKSFEEVDIASPEVKIQLANNQFYLIGGGVGGSYEVYKENMNIFEAIAMAGDISSIGDKSKVKIVRRGDDGLEYTQTFDLRKESIVYSEFYYIRPNDMIYIPTTPKAFFRIETVTSFISMVLLPISLVTMSLSFFK